MTKKTATMPTKRRKSAKEREAEEHRQNIAATVEKLKQMKPKSAKAAKAIALFITWLEDESGYDEETWPQLKKALNDERDRVGARRLFDD